MTGKGSPLPPGYGKTPGEGGHAQEWIPAFAESTPRIGQKYSGGNDRSGVEKEKDMTLAATYSSNGLPH